jgi:hypothetical protein
MNYKIQSFSAQKTDMYSRALYQMVYQNQADEVFSPEKLGLKYDRKAGREETGNTQDKI